VSVPDVGMHAIEGIIFAAEAVVYVGSTDELPVEPVGPPVIAALDPSGEMPFSAGADAGAAMPAHVEKCPQRVTAITGNDDALTRDLSQKKVARCRDLVYAPAQIQVWQ
jgi:hypothetical protein